MLEQSKVNIIRKLIHVWSEHFSEGAKGDIAVKFYRDLFTSSNPHDLESIFRGFRPKVTDSMNAHLIRQVSDSEIKQAAFSVKGSSAPGEDGLAGLLYQQFWHIVGPCLTKEIKDFSSSRILPDGWNHTQLSLLPKIANPTKVQDMTPISLCSVQYKIISKILCNRLKVLLPEIISDTQGAFVSGRLISDNVIIAHEMIHGLRTRDNVAEGWMTVKTDMPKAYDRVEWNFLEVLMEKMGFDKVWRRWIMAYVSTVSFSILMNGISHGFIKPERGIRQGDPLSPFLFILCAEALVNRLNVSEEEGRLNGIKLATECPSVHHLLFADDSMLLCKANKEEASELIACLSSYGEASGQVVNPMKSSIIFGSKVSNDARLEVMEALGIHKEGGEGTYLGLPECFSGSKVKLMHFILEKLQGRLNGWFSKSLSHGGKEILLKSIALALPVYTMSCFKLPKEVCSKITSTMIEFWWSSGNNRKKIAWVAWQKLCKDKELGGLAFHDIEKFNQSLLAKQAWRIMSKPESLIARILKAKYFPRDPFLEGTVGQRPSYAWRSILHGRELLKQGLIKEIGNGEGTGVWLDNWVMETVPMPPDYHQDALVDLTMTVSELIDQNTGEWNRGLVRQIIAEEDVERVLKVKPNMRKEDSLKWGFSNNGIYNSKSGYKLLQELQNLHNPTNNLPPLEKKLWSSLWKSKAPPKLRHFMWRVLSGALAVKQQLRSRGIQLDPTCSLCGEEPESICHMLFHCRRAQEVWSRSQIPLPLAGFSQTSTFLNLHYLFMCSRNKRLKPEVRMAFPWIMWQIWKTRNLFLFEQVSFSAIETLEKALEEASIWLKLNKVDALTSVAQPGTSVGHQGWAKPPAHRLKCNLGCTWDESPFTCEGSWIVRDTRGNVLCHSRRKFSGIYSQPQAMMVIFSWVVLAMVDLKFHQVIFEFSDRFLYNVLHQASPTAEFVDWVRSTHTCLLSFDTNNLSCVPRGSNLIALQISDSVIRDQRRQSYVAHQGPSWLQNQIQLEASLSV